MNNFTEAVANLAGGCRLVRDDDDWKMVSPVNQPDGVTLTRLMHEGWLENMANGGACKISDAGLLAYLRSTDGASLQIEELP